MGMERDAVARSFDADPEVGRQQAMLGATTDEHHDVALLLMCTDLIDDPRRSPPRHVTEPLGESVIPSSEHHIEPV
jgi:hypothetical protein